MLSWGVAAIAGVAALGTAAPTLPRAFAASTGPRAAATDYPSWADVQSAKASEAAKNAQIGRIQGLISQLKADAAHAQAEAQARSDDYFRAQQAFQEAADRAEDLQKQATAHAAEAKDAADKAGRMAAQLYSGGAADDTALQLFLSGSAAKADDLLARLGAMDTVLGANKAVYADAVSARDLARSLTAQAAAQRRERDRLRGEAEKKMAAAQTASDAADAAVAAQADHLTVLQAQLAALQDATSKTVADYERGVEARRRAEEARKKREAEARRKAAEAAAEARRRAAAAEEARRKAAAAAAAKKPKPSGGGGGATKPKPKPSNAWVRPNHGWQSSGYGARVQWCGDRYCSTSYHYGVDLADNRYSNIYAAHSGTVTYAGLYGGYGNYIRIDHGGGIGTGYGHIANGGIYVRPGQHVSAGQVIAIEGNTGNSFGFHLHFEVYVNGAAVNPNTFMAARGISLT